MRRNEEIIFVRRKSAVMLFSEFMINFMFVWPFKFIRWCIRKIRDKRYDIDFSDYSDYYDEEEDFLMENVLDRAIVFATEAHEGQFRKGTKIPYILHPLEAASIVGTMTTDNEVIAGAVLHDVVEDTDTTIDDVQELFGDRVAYLVYSESENKRENLSAQSTWKVRKQETLDHLKTAPVDVKMITLGDKLSNMRAIHRDYNTIGDELWQRFNQKNKNEHYWYYQSIADCLTELKDYQVYKEYCDLIDKTFNNTVKQTTYNFVDNTFNSNPTLKYLWYNGSESDWQEALNAYYYMLGPEQRVIEDYIENVDVDIIRNLDENGFYEFLYDKYFVWKYTAKNRLATTRMNLEKYIKNGELSKLKSIQRRIFATPKSNVGECLEIACEIYGLGTAGASGLLAILFPADFGTVDQFVVRRLQEINHPVYDAELNNMNPEGLKIKDGIILVEIMKEKANELNKKFNTDFWTPRKIDMILWAFGR